MIQYLNNDNFKETVENNKVVLVDFYADWCGPCKAIHPTLETLSEEYDGKVVVSKVNVDDNPELSSEFGIRSIPALYYFKNGELVEKSAGAQPKSVLSSKLDSLID